MLRFLVQVNCVACDVPWFKVKHFYLNSAMFGNKAKTIVKELEPSNFFALEEADQTAALDALNDYATTQSKLNQLVEEDMLGRFGRIIRGANKAHLLPAVHHKLMSTVQTFAKIESFRTKFGVDSGMCGILMTEIGNLISTVDRTTHIHLTTQTPKHISTQTHKHINALTLKHSSTQTLNH